MPRKLPEPHYAEGTITRKVSSTKGYVAFRGRLWKVSDAFCGERLAIRPIDVDGHYGVYFASHLIALINLTE